MMAMSRRTPILTSAILALSASAAHAQPLDETCLAMFVQTPVTVVVGNSPGGGYDTYARTFAPFLGDVIGSDVRVANIVGGGGILAARAVAEQSDNEILILLDDMSDVISQSLDDGNEWQPSDFATLGTVLSEPRAWYGRLNLDLNGDLVAGAGTAASADVDVHLVAESFGNDVTVIAGYSGSNDQKAAILRGEIDFTSPTLGTAIRNAEEEGLEVVLVVTDEPTPLAPNVPALGDLVRAAGDAGDMSLAEIAFSLTYHHRGLMTAASVEAEQFECLRQATGFVLGSSDFVAAAEAQRRRVAPLPYEDAVAAYDGLVQAWADYETLSRSGE